MLDMKNLIRSLIAYPLGGLFAGIAVSSVLINLPAAENAPNLAVQISSSPIFYQNLMWIGDTPPPEAENQLLWKEIQNMSSRGVEPSLPALEKFIADHPGSPWLPSLRANL